ncbi:winged helix-turn-helix transcriptional regulator [Kibdelosporangium aridum]|uniref:winged helix-turn-helix transcriptional regulator n=1 Tax=Kibdelosporangium aridum TaxID=2030 RepID=UPI00068A9908
MQTGDTKYLQLSRDLRHLLAGDWITHILVALRDGPLHYKDLHAAIEAMTTYDPWTGTVRSIQPRVMVRTLRRMETAGLVNREDQQTFPRSVIYSLTPAGADLLIKGQPLVDWAQEHIDLIHRLQQASVKSQDLQPEASDEADDDVSD